jgi:DNA-binding GntR family transcriptional regulator/flavin reductase (DIM6/NTAB) family NADH-FMN oxidoreductase RutF
MPSDTIVDDGESQPGSRLEDRVYSYILDELAHHRIRPESRLEEERYARACGVSRSPVRLALRRLEAEGVVEIVRGKGATVRSASAEEVRNVLELRRHLEAFVAGVAAQRITPEQLEALRALVAQEREACERGDLAVAAQRNFAFHLGLAEAAGNPLAVKFLRELLMRTYHVFLERPGVESGSSDHDRILAALTEGDAERAREAAGGHVDRLLEDHVRMIADRFRAAFRRHSTTVTVLTYYDREGRPSGMTATSVASLSAAPPSLIACLNRSAKSRDDIIVAGKFGVNVLASSQEAIATHCSRPGGEKILRPEWLVEDADAATPLLRDAVAHLDCRVARVHDEYTHSIIVADVLRVWLGSEEMPLIYGQGAYQTLDGRTESSYEALWERIATAFL